MVAARAQSRASGMPSVQESVLEPTAAIRAKKDQEIKAVSGLTAL